MGWRAAGRARRAATRNGRIHVANEDLLRGRRQVCRLHQRLNLCVTITSEDGAEEGDVEGAVARLVRVEHARHEKPGMLLVVEVAQCGEARSMRKPRTSLVLR